MRNLILPLVAVFSCFLSLNVGAQCDCENLEYDPVCAVNQFGDVLEFGNSCEAECLGFEVIDAEECGFVVTDPLEGDCDVACAMDQEGNTFEMPVCLIEVFGFVQVDDADCSLNNEEEEEEEEEEWVNEEDCEEIVCAIDQEGNIFEMPLCLLEVFGFELADTDDCAYVYEEEEEIEGDCETLICVIDFDGVTSVFPLCIAQELGLEVIGEDGDCEEIIIDDEEEWENNEDCEEIVCAIDQEGNIFEMPLCLLEVFGFELADTDDCIYVYEEEEEIEGDCETVVCAADAEGNVCVLPLCIAESLGYEVIGDEGDCDEFYVEEEWENEGDCEEIVCAIDQEGNIFEMPLCLIEVFGFEIADTDDCTYVYEEEEEIEGDCETLVCVIDFDGVVSIFPLCIAEELGLEVIGEEGDCIEIIDEEEENPFEGDCEELVCVIDQDGNIFPFPLCLAQEFGFEVSDDADCDEIIIDEEEEEENPFEGDCEELVCVIDQDGNIFPFPLCFAEELGFEVAEDADCDEIIIDEEEGEGENPFEGDCEEIVCVIDEGGNVFAFPLCLAEEFGFDVADVSDCDLIDEEFDGEENNDQISVEDLEDLGDWVFDTEEIFFDHNGGFFIETAFPNPTEDMINISVSSEYVNKVNYVVRGLDGRIVLDNQIVLAEGSTRLQLNLNDQPGGIYMVQIIDNNGFQATTRVVKLN